MIKAHWLALKTRKWRRATRPGSERGVVHENAGEIRRSVERRKAKLAVEGAGGDCRHGAAAATAL